MPNLLKLLDIALLERGGGRRARRRGLLRGFIGLANAYRKGSHRSAAYAAGYRDGAYRTDGYRRRRKRFDFD